MKKLLRDNLLKIIGNKKALILAGHFPLIVDNENNTIPCIYQEIKKGSYEYSYTKRHPYMGTFPMETFKLGVSLLQNKGSKILLLVNDHQYIKKNGRIK